MIFLEKAGLIFKAPSIHLLPPDSHLLQRPEHVSGFPGPPGRRQGFGNGTLVRQGRVRQRERRAGSRREETRAADHHQGQATGNAEGGVRGHAEAHQTHQGAAVAGDGPEHESNPGNKKNKIIKKTPLIKGRRTVPVHTEVKKI